jgi:hypothetical protein
VVVSKTPDSSAAPENSESRNHHAVLNAHSKPSENADPNNKNNLGATSVTRSTKRSIRFDISEVSTSVCAPAAANEETKSKRDVELKTSEEIPLAVSQPESCRPPRKASLAVKDLVQKMVRNQFEDSDEESAGLGSEDDEDEEDESEEDKGKEGEGEEGESEADEGEADEGEADEGKEDELSDELEYFDFDPVLEAFLNEKPAEVPPTKSKDKASKKKSKKLVIEKPEPEPEASDAESKSDDGELEGEQL